MQRALNHMGTPQFGWTEFLALAKGLGCVGVEFRNDLSGPLFDGADPSDVGATARTFGLRILALSEVKAFNDWSDAKRNEAVALMNIAKACGAEMVSLIARNDGQRMSEAERRADLAIALRELMPDLEDHGLIGLIEPLGFETCNLRNKAETIETIEALGAKHCFRIVHDTFHHAISSGGPVFSEHTGMVHISGIAARDTPIAQFDDPMRGLVDADDRLNNVGQLSTLLENGYDGPISFEPFSPQVQGLVDPTSALLRSFEYVEAEVQAVLAS